MANSVFDKYPKTDFHETLYPLIEYIHSLKNVSSLTEKIDKHDIKIKTKEIYFDSFEELYYDEPLDFLPDDLTPDNPDYLRKQLMTLRCADRIIGRVLRKGYSFDVLLRRLKKIHFK